jgi:hypothetical protein
LQRNSYILGLDVGLNSTGAILARVDPVRKSGYEIVKIGTLKANREKTKSRKEGGELYQSAAYAIRCGDLYTDLVNFTSRMVDVSGIVAELPVGGGINAIALAQMMCAVGVVGSLAAAYAVPLVVVTPAQSKKEIGGMLNASKGQVEAGVRAIFNDYVWPEMPKNQREHIMDAAAALYVGRSSSVYKILAKGTL